MGKPAGSANTIEGREFDGQTRTLLQASRPMRRRISFALLLGVAIVFARQTLSGVARDG
jgi:hypothetical protein